MSMVDRLISIARAEIGYVEKKTNADLDDKIANAGSGNWTKYAATLDTLEVYNGKKNGYPWCDVFVDWCFIMTFGTEIGMRMTHQPMGGYGAGCTNSAGYYRKAASFHRSTPSAGDQIFFLTKDGKSMSHTGIVEGVRDGRVYTIEGNTSPSDGVEANGGMVCAKSYPLNYSRIGGYGVPNWALVKTKEGEDDMTQDKFNEMFNIAMAAYRTNLRDNDSSSYSEKGRQYTIDTGLFVGGNVLPDGSPNYMWEDFMTREQFATVLYRFAQNMGKA